MMSPWLFKSFMDVCMRKMKAKMGYIDTKLKFNENGLAVVACMFADDTAVYRE